MVGSKWRKAKLALGCVQLPRTLDDENNSNSSSSAAVLAAVNGGHRRQFSDAVVSLSSSTASVAADCRPSSPITPTPSSSGLRFSRSSSKSSKKTCAICLSTVIPGQGHAIFTAECSHSFHFNCITSNVKHGNHICPICRAKWTEIPSQGQTSEALHGKLRANSINGNRDYPVVAALQQLHLPQPDFNQNISPTYRVSEPAMFDDDDLIDEQHTFTNTGQRVQDLLALSYDDLPYDLKPCFQYLCVFPEDCQIPAGMLTRMWIAEGLVTVHNEEMSQEDVAMQLLEELSHRSMIKIVRTNFKGTIKAIQLHDLLRDLCVKKAKEENFLQIFTATSSHSTTTIQPRRAALHSSILLPTTDSNLRSLVLLTRSSILHSAYESKETLDLRVVHKDFKLLRLLNLWGIKTVSGTLPIEIGRLIHLRYLGVRA